MPHHATVHPMSDVVPHAVSFDSYPDCVSTRRLVHWDSWHEGADASRRHRWNERHDSTSFTVAAVPAMLRRMARQVAGEHPAEPVDTPPTVPVWCPPELERPGA